MAEIIAEPTALSKAIALKFKINDVDVPKTTQLPTNKQFNTTDTDAWFTFELDGLASTNGTYDLTLINLDDTSIFHHSDVIFPALPFHYKLNSSEDVTLNEIRHAGRWLGQLVVTMGNGDTTSRQFGFNIAGHILDGQDAQVILLSDYQALVNTINLAKDELTQYNVDHAALLVDIAAAEDARVTAYNQLLADQQANIEAFDVALDEGIVAANLAQKLQDFETTNNSRLLSTEQQLADIATQQVVWNRADTNRRPLISFTADDGTDADITVMGPILKRYNVPATVSLITDTITNIDEYKNLQDNYGWEIASHSTDSTLLASVPIADCEEKLKESKRILESYGFNIKSFVYPSGSANANIKRVAKKYYEAGYNYDDRVNTENFIDSFSIHRVPLGSFYTNPSHNTLEYYKECVDKAYDNNGWCVFCLHPYKADFDEIQQGYLEQLIQYIISKNIEMVTLSDGYRIFGNVVEAGSSYNTVTEDEYQRFVVSNDGRTNLPIFYEREGGVRSTNVPKDFRDRTATICYVSRYVDATFPDSASGITITIRANDITNQMWLPSNSNRIYKRVSTNITSFGSFSLITPIVGKTGINNYSASQSNAALANEQITVTEITNGNSLGFPTKTGTLISKRFPNFTSQTYLPSDDDEAIYRRHWDANTGTWTPFVNPLRNKHGNMYSTVFSMSHIWTSLPIRFVSWLYIDKFVSMQGGTPTLSKQSWSISEISSIDSEPTQIGNISSNGQKLYVYKSDTKLYFRYGSVGNNYPAAISLIYM